MTEKQMPAIDIGAAEWQIVQSILATHVPDCEVWAFGSRARRSAKRYSDLDMVVVSSEPMTLTVRAAMADAFTESDLPWKVDVLDWATTSAAFRDIITQDKVVVQRGITDGKA